MEKPPVWTWRRGSTSSSSSSSSSSSGSSGEGSARGPPAHTRPAQELLTEHGVDPEEGLSSNEAAARLAANGPNELIGTEGVSIWRILFRNIFNSMNAVLGAAIALSAVAGDTVEAVIIAVIIIANTLISIMQEYKSEKTLDALRQMSAPFAHVMRDGNEINIAAAFVVVGDIVVLREGDQVPADVRLVEAVNIEIDEALLTGESLPSRKNTDPITDARAPLGDRKCMAYKSTVVTIGHAVGVVTAVGMRTELGRIAETIASASRSTSTPLERQMSRMMFGLLGVAVILAVIVFAVNRFVITTEVLLYALALSVAIIPEALPAVQTVTYAVAVRRVARAKAIVRTMNALESLGCVTDICSDKTGTLTLGRMTTVALWTLGAQVNLQSDAKLRFTADMPLAQRMMLLGCALCNTAAMTEQDGRVVGVGDPTEVALLQCAADAGLDKEQMQDGDYPFEAEMPFDAALKRMTLVSRVRRDGKEYRLVLAKGAAETVLERCTRVVDASGALSPVTEAVRSQVQQQTHTFSDQALRVLAFAYREDGEVAADATAPTLDDRDAVESEWVFCGLVGMQDPPRSETAGAVALCREAGIVVHMVTGDHPRTAAAIARRVGILQHESQLVTARAFDAMTDEQIDAMPELPHVIARCAPASKVKLINALHRRKCVVAMTGDGVNDAPAVRHADIGVAMGKGGTDVTKQAADMVLTDDNFATIVMAVAEGRRVIGNIGKFTVHLLSGNVSQVLILVVGLGLVGEPGAIVFPMSAMQILWMNLVTSSIPSLLLGLDAAESDVMSRPPRSAKQTVFSRESITDVLVSGVLMGGLTLLLFALTILIDPTGDFDAIGCNHDDSPPGCAAVYRARSVGFVVHSLMLLLHTYNCLNLRGSIVHHKPSNNRGLTIAVAVNAALLVPLVYIPYVNTELFLHGAISWEWGLIGAGCVAFILLSELYKFLKRRYWPLPTNGAATAAASTIASGASTASAAAKV